VRGNTPVYMLNNSMQSSMSMVSIQSANGRPVFDEPDHHAAPPAVPPPGSAHGSRESRPPSYRPAADLGGRALNYAGSQSFGSDNSRLNRSGDPV